MQTFTRYAEVTAVLADPGFTVVPAGGGGGPGTLDWLRRTVCRFSEGEAHRRRRAVVERELARLDPAELRRAARVRPDAVAVLGRALGVTDLETLTAAVPVAAAGYLTGDRPPGADAAVAALVGLLGPGPDETVANRIAILVQACEATATLVRSALGLAGPDRWDAESLVVETLRFAPPVPALRRVSAGTPVVLDVRSANRDPAVFADPERFDPGRTGPAHLTFGAGRRPCPGAVHAVQIAAGAVEALR
ncbi:cytochrome P450 [Actinomadura kijaniata]|uniref:cytochrome P450 n=1 Tax=Actinomadura kijaniata TaxID=46161 RepID=UPI000830AC46|nr:cytochrome P450 [Actinomadura kijaniata]